MTYEPMPWSDHKARFCHFYYRNHLVDRKGQATLEQFALRGRMYDASWFRPIPTGRGNLILDVGFGTGSVVWCLQQRGYAAAEGIDVSAEQIEVAGRIGVYNIAVADLTEHVGERPGPYDILISARCPGAPGASPDPSDAGSMPRGAASRWRRAGAGPNAEAPLWGRIRYGDFTREIAFTEGSLRQLFATFGFGSIPVYPPGPVDLRVKDIPRQMLWRCLEAVYRLVVFVETGRRWAVDTESIMAMAPRDRLSGQP